MGEPENISNAWMEWSVAALVTRLAYIPVDYQIGLYGGASSRMSLLQAANLFLTSLVYRWWVHAVALAASGDGSAFVSALLVPALWAFLWDGAVGFVVSAPPSGKSPTCTPRTS